MADNNTNELDALMISELPTQATANETDLFEVAIVDANSASGYASKKESAAAIADAIVGEYQYPLRLTETTSKTISGAINEIAGEVADLKDLEGSASGDIATFVDGSDNPLKELEISIVAVQSGSGDPSPTNVRPITGWTGANILHANENLFSMDGNVLEVDASPTNIIDLSNKSLVKGIASNGYLRKDNASYSKNGDIYTISSINSSYGIGFVCPIVGNKSYYISCNASSNIRLRAIFYSNKFISSTGDITSRQTVSAPVNADYLVLMARTLNDNQDIKNIQVGASSTEYNSVSIKSIFNIDWQSTAGTVYGGTLDVKTGVLTVNKYIIKLNGLSWVLDNSAEHRFRAFIDDMKTPPTVNDRITNIMCSSYKVSGSGIVTSMDDLSIMRLVVLDRPTLLLRNTNYSTAEELTASFTDNDTFVYPLATPVTYQLTPTEVRSLLGVNNIWADCGSVIELKYIRDLNLCINDIIARIEALEGANSTRSLSLSPTLTKSLTSDSDTTEGKTEETEEETKEEAQKNER